MNVTGVHSNAAESGVDQPFIFHFQVVAPVAKEICYWMDTQVVKTEQCFKKSSGCCHCNESALRRLDCSQSTMTC